jgi:hypothetical protein
MAAKLKRQLAYLVCRYLTINWGISVCLCVCVSVCLYVCLSVRLYVSTVLNGSSTHLEEPSTGHDTFRGLYICVCARNARARACVRAKRARMCVRAC